MARAEPAHVRTEYLGILSRGPELSQNSRLVSSGDLRCLRPQSGVCPGQVAEDVVQRVRHCTVECS
jgi:hypothetical protein